MQYRMKKSGEVVEEQTFREMFPQVSLPSVLTPEVVSEYGADELISTPTPPITPYQTASTKVELNANGKWELVWVIVDIVDEDKIKLIKLNEEVRVIAEYKINVQNILDDEAKKHDYDNIINASLRAAYPGPFHEEGLAFATWMDACWGIVHDEINDARKNNKELMSAFDLVLLLPTLVLPK